MKNFLLSIFLSLACLLMARPGSAQQGSASAAVTIMPADPAARPVPEYGLGVSWAYPAAHPRKQRPRTSADDIRTGTQSYYRRSLDVVALLHPTPVEVRLRTLQGDAYSLQVGCALHTVKAKPAAMMVLE